MKPISIILRLIFISGLFLVSLSTVTPILADDTSVAGTDLSQTQAGAQDIPAQDQYSFSSTSIESVLAAVEAAESAIKTAEAELDQAGVILGQRKVDYDRSVNLAAEGAISQQQLDDTESAYMDAQAQLKNAQRDMDSAKADLSLALSGLEAVVPRSGQSEGNLAKVYPAQAGADNGVNAAGISIAILIGAVLMTLALTSISLIWRGLFPRRVEWVGEIMRRRLWLNFWIGFLTTLILALFLGLMTDIARGDVGETISVITMALLFFLLGMFSLTSIVEWVGDLIDSDSGSIKKTILGSATFVLLLCIPIIGWLLMLGLFFVGVGAALLGYAPRRPMPIEPVEEIRPVE